MLTDFKSKGYVGIPHWNTGAIERVYAQIILSNNTLYVTVFPKYKLIGDGLTFGGHSYSFTCRYNGNAINDISTCIEERKIRIDDTILKDYTWQMHREHILKCARDLYCYDAACYLCGDNCINEEWYNRELEKSEEKIDSFFLSKVLNVSRDIVEDGIIFVA